MKNLNFLKLFFGTMLLIATTAFVSCVDDNDDTEAPYLEVSPTNLIFTTDGTPAEGSQSSFEISTNRHWTATVKDDKSWVTLSATEGDGSATIQVSIPENINDEASIEIQISNKVGPLMTETVKIKSGTIAPTTFIYTETFGTTAPKSSPYPFVDSFNDWVKSGDGSANVDYTGPGASVRQSGKLSAGYEGASGADKLFFGSNASFTINKIALATGQTNLRLTFGGSYSKNTSGVYDNEFKQDKFHFYLSADGITWSDAVSYTFKQADEFWVFATADFTLKNATSTLYIKFVADEASVFAIDDPTLTTGNGGQIVDLEGGDTPPTPTNAIYTETFGTTAPKSSPYPFVDSFNDWVKSGDGSANVDYTGPGASVRQSGKLSAGYEGASGADKLFFGSNASFTINKIALATGQTNLRLTFGGSYSKNTSGVYDNEFKQDKFHFYLSADGTTWSNAISYTFKQANEYWIFATADFTLKNATSTLYIKFMADEASVFSIDDPTLTTGNGGQIVDLEGGGTNTPTIVSVSPTSLTFPSTGGSKDIQVNVSNAGNNTLSVSVPSGILSATVDNTKVTVHADPNTTQGVINQKLTITLTNGNSVEVPITVLAPGDGSTFDVTLTSDEIATMSNSAYAPFSYSNSFGAWSGKCAITASGTDAPFLQINFNSDEAKTAFNSHIQVPQQAGIVQKVVITTSAKTFFPRYILLCETGYSYAAGTTQANLDGAAKAKSNVSTDKGGTFTLENLEGLNLSQFSIFPGGGAVYISSITITYKRQ